MMCNSDNYLNEYGSGVSAIRRDCRHPGIKAPYFKANHPFMYFVVNIDKTEDESIEDFYNQKLPTELLFAGTFC
uniref:Uncharacterized protein n=1 Tax=Panagrolaimus sp. PS1159 TaxID=55785 RepID=A0AC35G4M5_9BILA